MKKLNKTQKQEIKKKIIKGVNILCYVLSVLFVILMVVVGVQSCQKQSTPQSAEEETTLRASPKRSLDVKNNSYFVYKSKYGYNYSFTITKAQQSSFIPSGQINFDIDYTIEMPLKTFTLFTGDGYVIESNGAIAQLISINGIYETFQTHQGSGYWNYRLSSVYLVTDTTAYHFYIHKQTDYSESYLYTQDNAVYPNLYLTEEVTDNPFIDYFFTVSESSNFTFNKVYNYNAPIGSNLLSAYGTGGSWTSSTSDTAYIDYDTGYFLSNNQVFNKIRVYYFATGSMYFKYDDGTIKIGPSGSWSFMFLYYINTLTNTQVLVNQRDLVAFMPSSGTYGYYNANSSTWVTDAFREITFLQELNDDLSTKINAFNNNNQNQISGFVGSGDVTNVFTLVGSAFTGLLPILSMYILPGITIGTLMFIPLVATLVFVIIKVIKK